jgi:hypothetical protein
MYIKQIDKLFLQEFSMKKSDVVDVTIRQYIPSCDGLPEGSGDGSGANDDMSQPISQGSSKTQSPSGLVQDTKPESTTIQPGDSMSRPAATPNTNGIALGPRG